MQSKSACPGCPTLSWNPEAIDEFLVPGALWLAVAVAVLLLARLVISRRYDTIRFLVTAGLVVAAVSLLVYVVGFVVLALIFIVY